MRDLTGAMIGGERHPLTHLATCGANARTGFFSGESPYLMRITLSW
ncbi:hypothetical protein [Stenotrophomonas maltophilia]|nr:hypothetical protein [Stenotrophomonas maltophilia]